MSLSSGRTLSMLIDYLPYRNRHAHEIELQCSNRILILQIQFNQQMENGQELLNDHLPIRRYRESLQRIYRESRFETPVWSSNCEHGMLNIVRATSFESLHSARPLNFFSSHHSATLIVPLLSSESTLDGWSDSEWLSELQRVRFHGAVRLAYLKENFEFLITNNLSAVNAYWQWYPLPIDDQQLYCLVNASDWRKKKRKLMIFVDESAASLGCTARMHR